MLEILAITAPIFMIIAVGFTAVRLEFFSKSDTRALGMFVINFALPALIFKALSQRPFAEIMNVNYLLAYALGSLAVLSIGVSVAYFGQKKACRPVPYTAWECPFPTAASSAIPSLYNYSAPPPAWPWP
jgi:malonate transporter